MANSQWLMANGNWQMALLLHSKTPKEIVLTYEINIRRKG